MLRTALGDAKGGTVNTVEHFYPPVPAWVSITYRVEIDGPELPAFDGSAAAFADAIDAAGIVEEPHARHCLKVLKPVHVHEGVAFAEFLPAEHGLTLDIEIDFADPVIGRQRKS